MSLRVTGFSLSIVAAALSLNAQFGPPSGGGAATRAQQVPLSGRPQGSSVSVGQSTVSAGGQGSVNTLNSSVQIQGNIQGSISGNDAVSANPLPLTLADAVRRGLQFNLSAVTSGNAQRLANSERQSARAQLLPDINGNLVEALQQTNLAAAGLRFAPISLGPGLPTFGFPSIVGPYNYFDLRAQCLSIRVRPHPHSQLPLHQ